MKTQHKKKTNSKRKKKPMRAQVTQYVWAFLIKKFQHVQFFFLFKKMDVMLVVFILFEKIAAGDVLLVAT